MGQKTNPISNRIGITRGWVSNWCGGNYAEKIKEDYKIRKYLGKRKHIQDSHRKDTEAHHRDNSGCKAGCYYR